MLIKLIFYYRVFAKASGRETSRQNFLSNTRFVLIR